MALEASHIRFALDLKNKYQVSDIGKYLSGTIYPDSRYVTKIDRHLTHSADFMDENFIQGSDFRKGWSVHLLCDRIQYDITTEKLPELSDAGQGSDGWVRRTALKILQDMDDIKKFDIKNQLQYLECVETPNGEDSQKVLEYNRIFSNMYKNPEKISFESYYQMWRLFGIGDELSAKVKQQAQEYSKDEKIGDFIEHIYDNMLLKVN